MTETDARALRLDGLSNLRDLGGLPLRGGGHTRPGVLLRSESLTYLTPADVTYLVETFGLRLVLDLRAPHEIERFGPSPVATAGVETLPLTFLGESRAALPEAESVDPAQRMLTHYRHYLIDQPVNVVAGVRRLAATDAGPALVHCAAGKDRTGTLVALVLDTIGVERDAVIADYAKSAENVEAMFRRWSAAEERATPADVDKHKPQAETMRLFLAELDEEHGGAAGWLRGNGLTEAELAHLRERFADPGR